ncbi:choice-of-anchor D domain-containing protein, partial [bacterium]|nr:choice-of-anchor D domain-containing protein [bacterium]
MYKPISLFSAILLILVVTSVRADITEVGWIDTPGDAQHVCVADDYAYIADMTGGLRIIDVSDPENPDEVGVYNPGGNTRFMGVFVSGNTAYLCCVNTGFHVVDVSDPERPRLLGSANCPSFAREVKVVGNYAYVPTDSHGLLIYDVSDPEHPQEVGRCATQNGAWGIHVEGNYAYIANCDNGLYIVDISDPENPDVVGSCATRDRTMGIFVRGDYAFMADRNGFCVIDVADPENPDEVGHCQLPSFAADVYVVGEMAFVAVHSDGQRMVVIDVSDPENPDVVTDYRTRHEAFRLTIDGTLAYVAIRYNGLQILDVSDYAINGPIIEVSDEEIDFDEVGLNTTADMHLMIGNVGVEDLVISDITVEGEYFGTDFEDELIIEPDEEYELTVTFSPEERGAFEGNMTIISNDLYEEEPEIALFGEGVGPRISIIPHEMNFGDVGIDLSAELDLVIRNRGLNDLVISSVTNETEFFIFQFDEEVILEPNGRLAIPVTFSPVLGIDYEDTITISCNDPDNETVEVPLSGRGVGALISAEPDIIDFGDIGLARSSDQRLTIRNEGQLDLHVLDIVVEDPYFNVQFDGEFVIEPDRSHNITVTFAPERSGEFEGSLIIGSDDRQNEEFIVPLAGTGVGPRIAV